MKAIDKGASIRSRTMSHHPPEPQPTRRDSRLPIIVLAIVGVVAVAVGLSFAFGLIPVGTGSLVPPTTGAVATGSSPRSTPAAKATPRRTDPYDPGRPSTPAPVPATGPKAPHPCTLIPKSALDRVVPGAVPLRFATGVKKSDIKLTCTWVSKVDDKPRVAGRVLWLTLRVAPDGAESTLKNWQSEARVPTRDESGLGKGAFSLTGKEVVSANGAIGFGRGYLVADLNLMGWRQNGPVRTFENPAKLLPLARQLAKATFPHLPGGQMRIDPPKPAGHTAAKFASTKLPVKGCEGLSDRTIRALVPRVKTGRGIAKGATRYCRQLTPSDGRWGPTGDIMIHMEKFESAQSAESEFLQLSIGHPTATMNEVTRVRDLPELGDQTLVVAGTSSLSTTAATEGYAIVRRGDVLITVQYETRVTRGLGLDPTLRPVEKAYDGVLRITREILRDV